MESIFSAIFHLKLQSDERRIAFCPKRRNIESYGVLNSFWIFNSFYSYLALFMFNGNISLIIFIPDLRSMNKNSHDAE